MSQPSGCTVNYFCVGALLIFVGSISLCALGFTVVLPYEATRGWQETTCHVINSSYSDTSCSCQRQLTAYEPCVLKYPCLQIFVSFLMPTNSNYENRSFPKSSHTFKKNVVIKDLSGAKQKRSAVDMNTSSTLKPQARELQGMLLTTEAEIPGEQQTRHISSNTSFAEDITTSVHLRFDETTAAPQTNMLSLNDIHTNTFRIGQTSDEPDRHAISNDTSSHGQHENTSKITSNITAFQDESSASQVLTYSRTKKLSQDTEESTTFSTLNLRTHQAMFSDEEREAMIYRSWEDSFYEKCTLQECGDEEWNMKETSRFRLKWGRDGLTYTCFYDRNSPDKVVVARTKRSTMIHAVIWPVMTLLCGAGLWVGLFLGCCTMKTKGPEGETTKRTSGRRRYGLLQTHVTLPE